MEASKPGCRAAGCRERQTVALVAPEQAGDASLAEAYLQQHALHGGSRSAEGPQRQAQQSAGVPIHATLTARLHHHNGLKDIWWATVGSAWR